MGQMTRKEETELFDLCERLWGKIRIRFQTINLPWHDWEDIKAAAIARAFEKQDRFNAAVGKRVTFTFVVMLNATRNGLRNHLPRKDYAESKWKLRVRRPWPLLTKLREVNEWGDEEVVIEPDVLDDRSNRDAIEIEEFRAALEPKEKIVLDVALTGGRTGDAVAALGLRAGRGTRTGYLKLRSTLRRLRVKWDTRESLKSPRLLNARQIRPPAGKRRLSRSACALSGL